LHSREQWTWVLRKEWRELLSSRSWWLLLGLTGPLVGFAFIGAVRTYGEASGLNGTAAGVGEAFSPLVGVWAPTFSACELAAVFLLPFVGIRLFAADAQSGALKIEAQLPISAIARVSAKAVVLTAGWTIASLALIPAAVLWRSYGGTLYAPELLCSLAGHFLNAGLTLALAAAAAAVSEHPSTAAILTLAVTVGTWMVNFVAAVQGGWWDRAAAYTPTSMVAEFQRGLWRLDVSLVAVVLTALGFGLAAIWVRIGLTVRRRAGGSLVLAAVAALAIAGASLVRPSWDLSESRANSFTRADEAALRRITAPLRIEAHLAPEDPRRFDLERRALRKLRRVLPDVEVRYVSATTIGLFEQSSLHYGEVWYELGGRRAMSRVTTAEGVLESIYDLSGVSPTDIGEEPFRGRPLAAAPRHAGAVFYAGWPAVVLGAALWRRRRR
jgi:ABC-2 type transport system permease protein